MVPDKELDNKTLIAFYKQKFTELYHLDMLDWRVALILIPFITSFVLIISIIPKMPELKELFPLLQAPIRFIALIGFCFCFYGLWTVLRGQLWVTVITAIIRNVEKECLGRNFVKNLRLLEE